MLLCRVTPINMGKYVKKTGPDDDDNDDSQGHEKSWTEAFVHHLKKARIGEANQNMGTSKATHKTRLNLVPGKGVVMADLGESSTEVGSTAQEEKDDESDHYRDGETERRNEKNAEEREEKLSEVNKLVL
ncbi:hypothetical protein C0J52_13744 [Blattella germanica]|nr:hypothetical protein C0J52_13744 [Blattella germanica]